jgi:hypothetical protein
MVTAVPCLWVVLEMIFMLRSIPEGPFVMRNVNALRRLGVVFFSMTVLFLGSLFFHASVQMSIIVSGGAIFMIGSGLFSFTLAELIRQAIVFREENDLTI